MAMAIAIAKAIAMPLAVAMVVAMAMATAIGVAMAMATARAMAKATAKGIVLPCTSSPLRKVPCGEGVKDPFRTAQFILAIRPSFGWS